MDNSPNSANNSQDRINKSPNLLTATKFCLQNWNVADGRARRAEFWWFYLALVIISYILCFVMIFVVVAQSFALVSTHEIADDAVLFSSFYPLIILSVVYLLLTMALFIPYIYAIIRRLHDTGRSGWNFFYILIPFIGTIILLCWLAEDSDPAPNQYGPSPKYDPSMQDYYTSNTKKTHVMSKESDPFSI